MSRPEVLRTAVESSLLSSIDYSIDATLELEFRSGAIYRYFAVSQTVFERLTAAESKSAYFNRNVRNRFRYQRLV
ncbi:MAG TPA: KTSC domain-containing protein [Vicinamibacteria bacterium]|nr:KTSC domain-containing protein [Vicinamibacteria bacterium]